MSVNGNMFHPQKVRTLKREFIRMTRLAKLLKLIKSRTTIVSQFSTKLKIDNGLERLIIFAFFLVFIIHILSCCFLLLSQFASIHNPAAATWLLDKGYSDFSNF